MKKRLIASAVALTAALALVGGSTYALLTDEVTQIFSVRAGSVEISTRVEDFVTESAVYRRGDYVSIETETAGVFTNGGTATFENGNLTLNNVSPGDAVSFPLVV